MKVLVLDGNENQAVACVRSLAHSGHQVIVGSESQWSKAGWSKHCRRTFQYCSPRQSAATFVENVAREVSPEVPTLVLPLTDATTLLLSYGRDIIHSRGGRLVMPAHETILEALDKQQMTALANSLGIAIPQSQSVTDLAQAKHVARSLPFPVVLKPRASQEQGDFGYLSVTGRPLYARNEDEFFTSYCKLSRRCSSVLVQEYVEGYGAGYFALMRNGELRAEFAHRRIRDLHPTGSGSCLRMSVPPDPTLRNAALRMLSHLKWHGVAMVEFRVRPDGTPVFLEINGRFWNSLPLTVYSGADFPSLLAKIGEFGDVAEVAGYRCGVRCRWMLGDFRHLLAVWQGAPEGFPGKFPGRWRTTAEFFTPVGKTFHDNFCYSDPLPELGDWLQGLVRGCTALRKIVLHSRESYVQRRYSRS